MSDRRRVWIIFAALALLTFLLPALLVQASFETRLFIAAAQAAPFTILALAWYHLRTNSPAVDRLALVSWAVGFAATMAADLVATIIGMEHPARPFGERPSGLACLSFWIMLLTMVVFTTGLSFISLQTGGKRFRDEDQSPDDQDP